MAATKSLMLFRIFLNIWDRDVIFSPNHIFFGIKEYNKIHENLIKHY